LLGDGDKGFKTVYDEEKNIFYWADWSSQGRTKISCTGTKSPTNQPRKGLVHLYSSSSDLPQFQQSAGPFLSSLSGRKQGEGYQIEKEHSKYHYPWVFVRISLWKLDLEAVLE
jgi:hypothetical protein